MQVCHLQNGIQSPDIYSRGVQVSQMKDIKPQNRDCEICHETLGSLDDDRLSEEPIEIISCGHVYGHICLFTWYANFTLTDNWWHWAAVLARV